MPFGLTEKSYQLIKNVFQLYPQIEQVLIFGSRAMGTEKPGSDIDLALKGSVIGLEEILSLNNALEELPLAYEYDVIDYHEITNPDLQEHIDRYGLLFYQKEQVPNQWKTYKLAEVAEIETRSFDSVESQKSGDDWLSLAPACKLRPDGERLDAQYLSYITQLDSFKRRIEQPGFSLVASAQKESILQAMEVVLPQVTYQRTIAAFLNSFEEKIALNVQMNQTLETICQAIFQEWFLDFNFPGFNGQFEKCSLKPIPKGWETGTIKDIFTLESGFNLPSNQDTTELGQNTAGKYPIISARGIVGYHNEYKIPGPGVVMGRTGVIGEIYFTLDGFWPTTTSLFVKEYKHAAPVFAYLMLKGLNLLRLNISIAVPTITVDDVHELACVIPPLKIIEDFESTVQVFFQRIEENKKENTTLAALRNSFLPRLLTGKIEV